MKVVGAEIAASSALVRSATAGSPTATTSEIRPEPAIWSTATADEAKQAVVTAKRLIAAATAGRQENSNLRIRQ
jgi:hypothetical protein